MTAWTGFDVPTPSLIVDRVVLERNLDEMAALAARHGVHLVPHAKTHRMAELGRLQIERGSHGLCVAKLGEAEAFADAGIDRLFVAYPIVGADKAGRAAELAGRVELTLGTDSVTGARDVGRAFAAVGRTARLLLAVDTGMGREGVDPADAVDTAERIAALDGVDLVGIYSHEGSVYGATDDDDLAARATTIARDMVALADRIRARGMALPEVSLGSTASARVVVGVPGVTHVRPGIYAVNDLGQVALGTATPDSTAIRVVATVVSHPSPGRACIDAGSKALGADLLPAAAHRDRYPGYGLLVGQGGWIIDRLSEEHGWLRWIGESPAPAPEVGTRVEIIPNHACVVFAALRRATVVAHGVIVEQWDGFGPGTSV
ncbi:MAG: hypothetical protein JWP85_325 [Rhodoglobus sp.]|nr:hypothetical protein [Rhodoglobus sp.]